MIFEKVQKALAEQFEVSPDTITLDTNLVDDLGADSLDVVDLVMAIEDEFGVEIPDREALGIETVGDTIKLIEKYMNA